MNERELIRHNKLIALKKELLDMLGDDVASYVQKSILDSIDKQIHENAKQEQLHQPEIGNDEGKV